MHTICSHIINGILISDCKYLTLLVAFAVSTSSEVAAFKYAFEFVSFEVQKEDWISG